MSNICNCNLIVIIITSTSRLYCAGFKFGYKLGTLSLNKIKEEERQSAGNLLDLNLLGIPRDYTPQILACHFGVYDPRNKKK